MCLISSISSPVPEVPPNNFGICISMIVQQIPDTKPAMTVSEIYCTIFPAFRKYKSKSQHPAINATVGTADKAC